jgi:hypothetical protein
MSGWKLGGRIMDLISEGGGVKIMIKNYKPECIFRPSIQHAVCILEL